MPRLGIHDGEPQGEPLVVDLTTASITSWIELWGALQKPCGLPEWFGRNLDAWNDTLGTGAISPVLDAYPYLIIRVLGQGLFAPGNAEGLAFAEVTAFTGRGLQVAPIAGTGCILSEPSRRVIVAATLQGCRIKYDRLLRRDRQRGRPRMTGSSPLKDMSDRHHS